MGIINYFINYIRDKEFKGFGFSRSANRVARRDKRIIKKVSRMLSNIDVFKQQLNKSLEKGDSQSFLLSFKELFNILIVEKQGLDEILNDAQRQEYDVLIRLKNTAAIAKQKASFIHDPEMQEMIREMNKNVEKVQEAIDKSKDEELTLARQIERIMAFKTFKDLDGVASHLRRREIDLKKDIGSLNNECSEFEKGLKHIDDKMAEKERLKSEKNAHEHLRSFIRAELNEVAHLYEITHDAGILILEVIHEIKALEEIDLKANQTGFDHAWCTEKMGLLKNTHNNILESLKKIYHKGEDLSGMAHNPDLILQS